MLIFLLLLLGVSVGSSENGQIFFQGRNGSPLPTFTRTNSSIAENPLLVTFTDYQFLCCGEVTQWGALVTPGGANRNGEYSIEFQVLRPMSEYNHSCYELVGANRFTNVNLTEQDTILETPQNEKPILVQTGDTIGFQLRGRYQGDGIQLSQVQMEDRIWFSTGNIVAITTPYCPETLQRNSFKNNIPIVFMEFRPRECPTQSSTQSVTGSDLPTTNTKSYTTLAVTGNSSDTDQRVEQTGAEVIVGTAVASTVTVVVLASVVLVTWLSVINCRRLSANLPHLETTNPTFEVTNSYKSTPMDLDTSSMISNDAYDQVHPTPKPTPHTLTSKGHTPHREIDTEPNIAYSIPVTMTTGNNLAADSVPHEYECISV